MTLEEIELLEDGEDFDLAVSKYVFGNTDEHLDNAKDLMIPGYSTSRSAAARVFVHLAFSKEFGEKFNKEIEQEWNNQARQLEKDNIPPTLALFLVWATPDIICKAALRAVIL